MMAFGICRVLLSVSTSIAINATKVGKQARTIFTRIFDYVAHITYN